MINEIKSVIEKYKERIPVRVLAELLADIDEAEADCCEWKDTKEGIFHIKTNCGNCIETNYGYNFCPYCGKPIKIVEVE